MPSFTCLGGCSGVRRVLSKLLNQVRPGRRSTPAYASTDVPAHLISVLPVRSGRSKENS